MRKLRDSEIQKVGQVTTLTTIRNRGQMTIPAEARKAAHIEDGDVIEVEVIADGSLILRPKKLIDAAQAWFWTEEWQAKVRTSAAEIAAGEGEAFESDEDFLAALDE